MQAGSFKTKANADKLISQLKAKGFEAFDFTGNDGQYKVQCGAFSSKANAEALVKKLKAAGFQSIIK